jgi:hypothetical protein
VVPAVLGCFTYAPLDTSSTVRAGEHVAVEVTDRGRVELGDRLGSGVLRIEGTLTRADTQEMVLNVWRVAMLDGGTARWSGESVRFRRDFAARVQTRTLNRPRTYLAAGVGVVGLVLFTKAFGLDGLFIGGNDPDNGTPPASSRGWWY